MFLTDAGYGEAVGEAHGEVFDAVPPVATMVVVAGLSIRAGRSRSRPKRSSTDRPAEMGGLGASVAPIVALKTAPTSRGRAHRTAVRA